MRLRTISDDFTRSDVWFAESDDYSVTAEFGRRGYQSNPTAYSVSFNVRERSILAYQGGTDVTEEVASILHIPYRAGIMSPAGLTDFANVTRYMEGCSD